MGGFCIYMLLGDILEPYLGYLKSEGRCEKTIYEHSRFTHGALQVLKDCQLEYLKLTDVSLIKQAAAQHGKYGLQRAMVVTRSVLKYARASGIYFPIDWRDIKVPTLKLDPVQYLSQNELLDFINSIDLNDRNHTGLRMRTIIEVLFSTGLRAMELCSLNRNQIDLSLGEQTIEVMNCKTKQIQKVFLSERAIEWIKYYLSFRRDSDPALFISGRARLLPQTSRGWLRTHARNIGFKKKITHKIFRATLATTLLREKVDIRTVQDILRHASARTTMTYYAAASQEFSKKEHTRVMNSLPLP